MKFWLGIFAGLSVVLMALSGCGRKGDSANFSRAESGEDEEEVSPEERVYLVAAKPFAVAIANRKYDEAYSHLSSHGKARMSVNQFAPADDDAVFKQNEANPMQNISAAQFADLMKKVEAAHGLPKSVESLSVFETDPAVLSRQSKEELGALDSMFAIGAMPDSVPANIRSASVRGQIRTELTAEELAKAAKDMGTTVEELQGDEDFAPYFTIKMVLVEEDGQLKVGYFEFLPPSMLD